MRLRCTIPTRCTPCPGKKRAVLGCFFAVVDDCHRRCAEVYVAARMEGGSDRMDLREAVGVSLVAGAAKLAMMPHCGRLYILRSVSVDCATSMRRKESSMVGGWKSGRWLPTQA